MKDLDRHLGLFATLPTFDVLCLSGPLGGLPDSLVNFHVTFNGQRLVVHSGRAA